MPKIPSYSAATSWSSGDLLYLVRDPAGTPVSRKITVDNILQNLVCAANSSLIKSTTGYSLTGSNASSMIDLAGTWNTTGNPVALKIAMSNTASGATSKFLSCLAGVAGATEVASINKAGDISCGQVSASTISASTIYATSSVRPNTIILGGLTDIFLERDAANTLALRNGANAQTFRLYGTYTDASNYRRLITTMSTSGVAEIKPDGAGTGASGNVLHISGLPTSNPGPGILWNNAGTPAIGT